MATQTTDTRRMLATVLFTDIVGSTRRAAELGDRQWGEILDAHHAVAREQIEKHNGRVIATAGDGFFALFDIPADAVECARAMCAAVRPLGIEIRAGVHTGECEVMGDNVGGIAVHIGARVAAKAGASQVLVSGTVKDLVTGSTLKFKDRGSQALKGVPGKWRLFAVEEERQEAPAKKKEARRPLPGRTEEVALIEGELDTVSAGSLRAVSVEGEIGIGKTRLLEEVAAAAAGRGFGVLRATADEELRGPFLLVRSLLGGPDVAGIAADAATKRAVKRAAEVLAGNAEPAGRGLNEAEQQLHVFDVVTLAFRSLALRKPLALLLDDLQFVDEDSVRLIRFLARSASTSPIFLVLSFASGVAGDVAALATDFERLRLGARLRLGRLSAGETAVMLGEILGGPVDATLADAVHARGEGVPFMQEEIARSLRETGALQSIDGTWSMSPDAGTSVPASIQAVVERRLAPLPGETREALTVAAMLGRRFATPDLAKVLGKLSGEDLSLARATTILAPAVKAGLLDELADDDAFEYAFGHNQIRFVLSSSQTRARRRAVHQAIVDIMAFGEIPAPNLARVAHHALLAGDVDRATVCSVGAARIALAAHAPEEALRLLDAARAVVTEPSHRVTLLRLRDDALAALDQGDERAATLAELQTLANSLSDEHLAYDVTLRRAAAARTVKDYDRAAVWAAEVREAARNRGDEDLELAACLELGQALMRAPIGDSFAPPPTEADFDGAAEAYERAVDLAEKRGDERTVALAKRELGVMQHGRAKLRFLMELPNRPRFAFPTDDDPIWSDIDVYFSRAKELIGDAMEIFERLDDRRGVMLCVIALSYSHFHSGVRHGLAGVMERIRRMRLRDALTSESGRQREQAIMLYAIHVYGRAYFYLDLALDRGEEAFKAARALGERSLEFSTAGGVALTHVTLGEVEQAEQWLDRARAAAMADPTPRRARQLELWRGRARAAADDADATLERFERAMGMAEREASPAERCETAATVAVQTALLAGRADRDDLLGRAEAFAERALQITPDLNGQHPWTAQSLAVKAAALLRAGKPDVAATTAISAWSNLEGRLHMAPEFEARLLMLRVLGATNSPLEASAIETVREQLQEVALHTLDGAVRERWYESPLQRGLEAIVGKIPPPAQPTQEGQAALATLTMREAHLLRLVTSGMTNREIAAELGTPIEAVAEDVETVFSKLGVNSRLTATTFALREGVA